MEIKDDPILKFVNVKINHPKSQLQNMVNLVEVTFCFDEPKGNKEVIKTGKLLIEFIKELEKYKQIFKEITTNGYFSTVDTNYLKELKQKYFIC